MRPACMVLCAAVLGVFAAPAAAELNPKERSLIAAVNHARHAHGLPGLRASGSLGRSSEGYARWLMRRGRFGHQPRITAATGFRSLGETLAWRPGWARKPRGVARGWLGSPGHRAILLSPRFSQMGVGLSRGRYRGRQATIWVAQVGRR